MQNLPRPRELISANMVRQRLGEMADQISRERAGRLLTFVPVLNGAWQIMSILMSHLDAVSMQFEPVMSRSYDGTASMPAQIDTLKLRESMVRDRDVIIVEDILDSGQTLSLLRSQILKWQPRSLMIVVLLDKPSGRKAEFAISADCVGFTIEPKFVVGMGLDYRGYYRNLSYIGEVSESDRAAVDAIIATV